MGRVTVAAELTSLEDFIRLKRGELEESKVRRVHVTDALIDTGATNMSLPKHIIKELGLVPLRKRRVRTTAGIREAKAYGAIQLKVHDRDCICDVVEVADDCPVLIGQVPLELMDFVVDPVNRRLTGNPEHGGEQILELL